MILHPNPTFDRFINSIRVSFPGMIGQVLGSITGSEEEEEARRREVAGDEDGIPVVVVGPSSFLV